MGETTRLILAWRFDGKPNRVKSVAEYIHNFKNTNYITRHKVSKEINVLLESRSNARRIRAFTVHYFYHFYHYSVRSSCVSLNHKFKITAFFCSFKITVSAQLPLQKWCPAPRIDGESRYFHLIGGQRNWGACRTLKLAMRVRKLMFYGTLASSLVSVFTQNKNSSIIKPQLVG